MLAFILLVTRVVIPATGHMTYGFIGPYTSSRLLLQGELGPQAYDNDWFIGQVRTITEQPLDEVLSPNLPTMALMALPFAYLPPQLARDTWIWLNLFILLGSLGLLLITLHRFNRNGPQAVRWFLLLALAMGFSPLLQNFVLGKGYILMLAFYVGALWGLVTKRDALVGLALGLAFVFKTSGVLLWLLLLVCRRWKALGWGIGTVLGIVLISLPWIGLDTWRAYLQAMSEVSNGPAMTSTAYQTTFSFLTHLSRFDPFWNPYPLLDLPFLARAVAPVIALGAIALTVWRGWRAPLPFFFAALVPLSIILLPLAEEYQFVLLLVPIFVLLDDLVQRSPPASFPLSEWVLVGLALGLLMAPIPYKNPAISARWLALLAYPRMYGSWLLWAAILRRMVRRQNELALLRGLE
ncbi:MAG: glycosyltransferase family 87 protein [Anaerolineae bacterium]